LVLGIFTMHGMFLMHLIRLFMSSMATLMISLLIGVNLP
jgi:hypothetical protein